MRVRGPQLFKGYVDSSLDADAFDADGFLRTGDLGRLDADGYLVISGRLKDIIIRKGENISAKQVEDILYANPEDRRRRGRRTARIPSAASSRARWWCRRPTPGI